MSLIRPYSGGTWSPAEPLPLNNDFDVEVHGHGPYRWEAWVGMDRVAFGRARTRIGLRFGITRAKHKHQKAAL
ncbi:hypothetical protein [Streptomyces sp. NPDC007205]|uniref:hypothetical protein n=1 Tax=Streptomyces sp. NPDC007205 TaxID=3154316 RepID=UPI0033FA73B4